ncbi:MAG: nitroreductase family protein [Bacteroidales bacterium]|jgi:nitroreductase|nr:nitroreductase family protein [Bacteroidales bacterium]
MKFSELAKYRQSVRDYEDRPLEKEKINRCIESTRLSPSANNAQPWKFIVVDEPKLKNEVASAVSGGGMNKFSAQAPVIIAVVLEKRDVLSSIASVMQNKEYSLIDVGIAVNQFCLQAADLGLGTCIIGWFNEKKVKKLLNVPCGKRMPLVITMGYSKSPIRNKTRKPIEEMSSWNKY